MPNKSTSALTKVAGVRLPLSVYSELMDRVALDGLSVNDTIKQAVKNYLIPSVNSARKTFYTQCGDASCHCMKDGPKHGPYYRTYLGRKNDA